MELFGYIGWITVPEYIVNLILDYGNISVSSFAESIALQRRCYWAILGGGLGLFFIGVVFGGLGLMKLAKRAGIKHGWMGFFPFANTYLTGELAGETRMFGSRVKRIGLWTMVCEIVFVLLNIFSFVLEMCLMHPAYYAAQVNELGQTTYAIETAYLPASIRWMETATLVVYIVQMIYALVVLYMFCTMFYAFYRKYYARSPFLMTFLSSVLPGRGFAIFAVRNNEPVDYAAYMRRRMQQQQQYGAGGYYPPQNGGYNDPNGGYPPQNGGYPPQGGYQGTPPDEPFGGEFGGTPAGGTAPAPPSDDDPFSDF